MKQQRVSQMTVFYSYAQEDEALRQRLERHLSPLEREGWIRQWHHRLIPAGNERMSAISHALDEASIVLLLISPDFLASHHCYEVEMLSALQSHQRGTARTIPIILRPCDWQSAPFAGLECLPRGGKAVTEWSDPDAALSGIAQDLRQTLKVHTRVPHHSIEAQRTVLEYFLLCSLLANVVQLPFYSHGKWLKMVVIVVIGILFRLFPVNRGIWNIFLSRDVHCLRSSGGCQLHM
jgi:hypothetical protein